MKEKGIAIIVCVITTAVVMYAVVFISSRAQRIRSEPQVVAMQLDTEVKKQEEERWQAQVAEQDTYYHDKFASQQQRQQWLRKYGEPLSAKEAWMQLCLREGVFVSLDRTNHEVAIDPSTWTLVSVDSKWQMMELVHRYFDGYATIVSSTSGRPLASYNAWRGIQIHD